MKMTTRDKRTLDLMNKMYMQADFVDQWGDMDDTSPYDQALDYLEKRLTSGIGWHKYPKEEPDTDGKYLVTEVWEDEDGTTHKSCTIREYKEKGFWSVFKIIAWAYISPYEEDDDDDYDDEEGS